MESTTQHFGRKDGLVTQPMLRAELADLELRLLKWIVAIAVIGETAIIIVTFRLMFGG